MKFSATREAILKPLQTVVGVVERRQTMPILSNVLLAVEKGPACASPQPIWKSRWLRKRGRWSRRLATSRCRVGSFTRFAARCRGHDGRGQHSNGERLTVKAGRSRFTLSTLPGGGLSGRRGDRGETDVAFDA